MRRKSHNRHEKNENKVLGKITGLQPFQFLFLPMFSLYFDRQQAQTVITYLCWHLASRHFCLSLRKISKPVATCTTLLRIFICNILWSHHQQGRSCQVRPVLIMVILECITNAHAKMIMFSTSADKKSLP